MARILIVDDAVFMRRMLTGILEKAGHEVVGEASNGQEGYDKYVELKPDIVTLDITMPDINGISSLQMIKQDDPNARVIMCSAMGQKVMVTDAVKSGAKDFIVKPFQAEKVIDSINRALYG